MLRRVFSCLSAAARRADFDIAFAHCNRLLCLQRSDATQIGKYMTDLYALIRLGKRARRFFAPEATAEICAQILPRLVSRPLQPLAYLVVLMYRNKFDAVSG